MPSDIELTFLFACRRTADAAIPWRDRMRAIRQRIGRPQTHPRRPRALGKLCIFKRWRAPQPQQLYASSMHILTGQTRIARDRMKADYC
jgi:hypothetical protein